MKHNTLYVNTRKELNYFYLKLEHFTLLNRVYGSKYIKAKNLWVFPAFYPFYAWVIEDLESVLEGNLILDESVKAYQRQMQDLEAKAMAGDTRGFKSTFPPYDHQRSGLAKIMLAPRAAVFWDPGMGKTKVICDRILYERGLRPEVKTLILALRVNLSTWVTEMATHSGGSESIVAFAGTISQRRKILAKAIEDNTSGIVCTYETARVSLDMLSDYYYDIIVADECHKMQSYNSRLTKTSLALASQASYRYILSGTPTKGRPTDIWASLRFLGDFVVPKYWVFHRKYVRTRHDNRHIVIGYKNLDILNEEISDIADTKTSEECLDLPTRTFQVINVPATAKIRKVYNSIIRDSSGAVKVEGQDLPVPNLLTKLTKLSQSCMGFVYKSRKDPQICDSCPQLESCVREEIQPYTSRCSVVQRDPGNDIINIKGSLIVVEQAIELACTHASNGKKVVVWAKHRKVLDDLHLGLSKQLTDGEVLRYDSTVKNLGEVETRFNTNPSSKVLVAQITMGIGVTFKAPIMVYVELSFNLADWLQSLDRNWGIRAKGLGPILVQVLLIPGSIYEQTYQMLKNKIDVASLIKDRPNCSACPQVFKCLANNTQLYSADCVLDSKVDRDTIKLKELT